MSTAWIVVTESKPAAAQLATAAALGSVSALVIGSRELADAVAAQGPEQVKWISPAENVPVEAYAATAADLIGVASPKVVITGSSNADRVVAGVIAVRLEGALVAHGLSVSSNRDELQIGHADLGERVIETLTTTSPTVVMFGGDEVEAKVGTAAPVEEVVAGNVADICVEKVEAAEGADAGITRAKIVVSVGRGLKKKEDLNLIEGLAKAIGGEIGCSMPVADDLGWIEQARYVGRSGQHITPQLYMAVGIQGAPQHLEGVRGAKLLVGINNDPDAPIFKTADYGIVGDLYEVVPALTQALAG